MTKGGAKAVTTRNTVLARAETAATDKSPPGHTIVSKRTDRPDTIPTRFHLTPSNTETRNYFQKANIILSSYLWMFRVTRNGHK